MEVLCQLVNLYTIALIGYILLSWFPISPDSPFAQLQRGLSIICDPPLALVRRAMPMGIGGLDLSPMIVIFGIRFLSAILLGC